MYPIYTILQGMLHRPLEREFEEPDFAAPDANVSAARNLVGDVNIAQHRFFRAARSSPDLVGYWVTQELFITNPYSQLLLMVSSRLDNAHIRQMFLEVAVGEHGGCQESEGGYVRWKSHPSLLQRLGEHLGIDLSRAAQEFETLDYLQTLRRLCRSPMMAMGAIGAGNEQLLIQEYAAARYACVSACAAPEDVLEFFDANINANVEHGKLCETVAMGLKSQGFRTSEYLAGARRALAARVKFYDAAARRAKLV